MFFYEIPPPLRGYLCSTHMDHLGDTLMVTQDGNSAVVCSSTFDTMGVS